MINAISGHTVGCYIVEDVDSIESDINSTDGSTSSTQCYNQLPYSCLRIEKRSSFIIIHNKIHKW